MTTDASTLPADDTGGRAVVPPTTEPRPLRWWREFGAPPRIMGLDVARALAVLGMVGAHIGSTPVLEIERIETWGSLVHGRSSILFAVLAGVSIALMTGRTRIPAPERMPGLRLNLVGRGAAIFVIGLALELLGTPIAVILTVYGLLYVAAIPFLRWRISRLLIAAGVLAVLGPPLLAGLQVVTLGSSGPGVELVVFGSYPITVWMAFVLAGMAIGRMPLDRVRTAAWMLLVGVVISVVGYLGLGVLGAAAATSETVEKSSVAGSSSWVEEELQEGIFGVPPEELDFTGMVCDSYVGQISCYVATDDEGAAKEIKENEAGPGEPAPGWAGYPHRVLQQYPGVVITGQIFAVEPHTGGVAEVLGSGGFAVAVIALCLLASRPLRWALVPLAALGSMPLTAYTGHIIAIVILAGPQSILSDSAAWGWFSLVLVVAATLWAMFFGRGPLERLVGRAAKAMASVPKS